MQRREFIKSVLGSAVLWKAPALLALQASSTQPAPDPGVKRVLVMFKCHFDAGFIDTQRAIVRRYFKEYFPRAMDLASQLRQSGSYRYVWTTGSWLLYEYLEQATPEERTRMEKAISAGDIAWHALPFSWQTELMDGSMISGSIGLSRALDRRFGRTTTGAKMTDVPGHTRGLIAPLAAQGVKFLDIGVNDASTPAEVPPLFLWKDPGGSGLVVMYHHGYGSVVRVPNSDLAIAMVVRDDNSGPHTREEIHETYSTLGGQFPNAQIIPTSLNASALRDTDGKVITTLAGYDHGWSIAQQPDGKIVVAGARSNGGGHAFAGGARARRRERGVVVGRRLRRAVPGRAPVASDRGHPRRDDQVRRRLRARRR